jgi:thymidylate synthase ThyX
MKFKYNICNEVIIGTLLQNEEGLGEEYASLIASYSRSSKSILDLIEERSKEKSIEVIKRIVNEYGHSSVRGLAHQYIFLEGLTRLDAAEFFYNHPLQDGQERSTRYQSIFTSISIPEYNFIIDKWLEAYTRLYQPTFEGLSKYFNIDLNNSKEVSALRARTLDCTRYLLPLSIKTSIGAIQSSREWSKYIKYLRVDNRTSLWGDTLESILTSPSYTPEAKTCIKYTTGYSNIDYLNNLIKDIYKDLVIVNKPVYRNIRVKNIGLLDNIAKLISPIGERVSINNENEVVKRSISYINLYNQYEEGSNELTIGKDLYTGYLDIGSLIDINRHRSIGKFIPLLHKTFNIYNELNRSNYELYSLCPYLDLIPEVKELYTEIFNSQYDFIKDNITDKSKFILPNGHLTYYVFDIGLKELIYISRLRSRPGGHIAYRQWANSLSNLIENKEINIDSREEFLDRS